MKHILMLNTLPINNFDKDNKKKTAGNQTLYNTLKGYSENGYKVTMITFFDVPTISNPFPNVYIRKSMFYFPFKMLLNMKSMFKKSTNKKKTESILVPKEIRRTGSKLFFNYWKIAGYLEGLIFGRKLKPDLIYGYEFYSTIASKKIAQKLNVPSVSRFQGTELGFFIDDEEKFLEAERYIQGTKVNSDLIIMANDGTDGDKVLEKLDVKKEKVRFWVNGLHNKDSYLNFSKDEYYREKLNLPADAFVICTANRFVDWKRIDRILKVISEIVRDEPQVFLIAIGDGPEKKTLVSLAKSLNLKNVIFTGALEHEEVIYHIANSDLYITLNHSGNLGNSILEALALGNTVCTLKNDSVEKVLKHNYNALLFNTVNEKEIAKEIISLIKNKDKMIMLKKNAKKYSKQNLLSWSERMEMEIEEIEKLIKKT